MELTWRSLFIAIPLGSLVVGASMAACGEAGERPRVADIDTPGHPNPFGEGGTSSEAGADAEAGAGADAEAGAPPDTCRNTIKDGAETDTDCGGNVCDKCRDGKTCIAKTDCAGDACLNGKCATPACTNVATDGDETDTDCGGSICPKCTFGKRCNQATDCVSGACTNNACSCPKGMVVAARAGGGGSYCIDEIEVTKAQYDKFLAAGVLITDQDPVCKPPTNGNFEPRAGWPPQVAPPYIQTPNAGKAFNMALPVHYVDWCDAFAYCKWANKQLCGAITGGPVAFDKANQADAGAWYNACSGQGNRTWPYSTQFEKTKCNGGEGLRLDAGAGGPLPQFNGYGFGGANQDLGIHYTNNGDDKGNYSIIEFAGCTGGVSGLYHMSGNVAEWEDSCDGTLPTSQCRVRGGSYTANDDQDKLRCAAERTEQRVPPPPSAGETDPLADIGFRCCLY
jgi:formylglycine-generating enzyme required for sulfatase activity